MAACHEDRGDGLSGEEGRRGKVEKKRDAWRQPLEEMVVPVILAVD